MDFYTPDKTITALESYALEESENQVLIAPRLEQFTLRPIRIDYEAFAQAIRKIAALHRRSRFNDYGGGLLITGISGAGKSSVLKYYRDYFPPREEADGRISPVLYVETPSAPTVKNLAEAILAALGDPASGKGTSEEKTRRIYKFFSTCMVELLLIDEFHHFLEVNRRASTREVTDWLKNLLNVTRVGVVLAGLPSCEQTIKSNQQLARRFSARYELNPFCYFTPEGQLNFRALLESLQSELPIGCISLKEDDIARRIFMASNGLIDYVIKLLEEACDIARRTKVNFLDAQVLAKAFTEAIWADGPVELNPFNDAAILRPLTQSGEPYALADQIRVSSAKRNVRR